MSIDLFIHQIFIDYCNLHLSFHPVASLVPTIDKKLRKHLLHCITRPTCLSEAGWSGGKCAALRVNSLRLDVGCHVPVL